VIGRRLDFVKEPARSVRLHGAGRKIVERTQLLACGIKFLGDFRSAIACHYGIGDGVFATGTTVALRSQPPLGAGFARGRELNTSRSRPGNGEGEQEAKDIAQRWGEIIPIFHEIVFGLFKSKALGGESLANSYVRNYLVVASLVCRRNFENLTGVKQRAFLRSFGLPQFTTVVSELMGNGPKRSPCHNCVG